MAKRPITRSQAFNSERNTNTVAQGLENSLGQIQDILTDIDDRLDVWEQSRIMPTDVNTQLYWPLNDVPTATLLHNEGEARGSTGNGLAPSSQVIPGYISNQISACVRLVGGGTPALRTAVGGTGESIGSPYAVSISCKIRLGTTTNSFIIGYYNTAPNGIVWISQAAGILLGNVRVAGVAYAAPALADSTLSVGDWHAVVMTYDGLTIRIYVDGCFVGSQLTGGGAGGTPEWGLAGTKSWYLGSIPVTAAGMEGFVRDVRVHNCARPLDWIEEDWLRFNREWPEA